MTAEELERTIENREMSRLELKESFGAECIETACAFANAAGGYVVIGVDDRGVPSKNKLRDEGLRDYENRISTATEPSVAVDAEKVLFRGHELIVLRVQENPLKPVACKGRCFIRKGSVNHQMTPAEIAECHLKSTGGSMDAVFVPGATKDDLDMDAVREYMHIAVKCKRRDFDLDEDPWRILLKIGLVESEDEITRAAYLLFAKDPQEKFGQAKIHAGLVRGGSLIIDNRMIRGRIYKQVDEALSFVQRDIKVRFEISGKAARDEYWDYPLDAVRETIANAVCHRDYGIGNDIQLKISEDQLSVWSPGLLPFDAPMEVIMNPDHRSHPRNRLIAQIFFDMGIIEQYGSGIDRIKRECMKNGSPFPEWKESEGGFLTTYQIRDKKVEALANGENQRKSSGVNERAGEMSGVALKTALKTALKDDNDEIVAKILAVYKEIANNTTISLSAVAEKVGLSARTVDEYVGIMKSAKVLRRKGGRKFGEWEILTIDNPGGAYV